MSEPCRKHAWDTAGCPYCTIDTLTKQVESQKEEIASWHTTQDKKLGRVIVETTEATATRCAEIAKKWHIGCVKAIRTEFQLSKEE